MFTAKIKTIPQGIAAAEGFIANGINCGLKKQKLDLGVIFSQVPAIAAGVFTKNDVKAAPVVYCMKNINYAIQAMVANSGNANACTGPKGYADTEKIAEITSRLLKIKPQNVLLFSTGVIGVNLDMKKIDAGLKQLAPLLNKNGHENMAQSILTTDTVKKEYAVEFKIKGKTVKLGGIAKGSGMIGPNLATMLVFLTSDINIEKKVLKQIFQKTADQTFNHITVDGDMSTNDSVVILCNGLAKNPLIMKKDKKEINTFQENLFFVMNNLAKDLIRDGEGVTKFITIIIKNAKTQSKAKAIAFKIANSPLVKTAFYGKDANWGRILSSAGSVGANFDQNKAVVKFGNTTMFKKGIPVKFSESKMKKYLEKKEIEVLLDLNEGKENFVVYTSDLTDEYIKINAHYRS